MGFVGFPGQAGRYVSGLCVATLGLCAAGWGRPNGPGLTTTIGPEPQRSRTPGPAA
jgi:hypothetical protein